MQKDALQGASGYLVVNRRHRIWKKIVCVLACVVVFCTTYALILPALTMENHTSYCGVDEHLHSSVCYEKTLICGQEEIVGSAHVHTDGCCDAENMLICGIEEGEEKPGHLHTDECYEWALTCKIEEHKHDLNCYSDPEADIESPEEWTDSVSSLEMTGDLRSDLVAVAESQLGYTESTLNYTADADGETVKGYTRYGAWYGDTYGDWNTMFVSFCLNYAGVKDFPFDSSPLHLAETLQTKEYGLFSEKADCVPETGDLMFTDSDSDGRADRVGIVAQITEPAEDTPGKLKVIEGDAENSVQYVEYLQDDRAILGYGKLPDALNEETQQTDEDITEPTPSELKNNDSAAEAVPTQISQKSETQNHDSAAETEPKHINQKGDTPDINLTAETEPTAEEIPPLPHHKTIDAFRDGEDNPDTDLDNQEIDKTDLHRLYLDVVPNEVNEPIDLLIVIDQSGSMHMNYTWGVGGWVTIPENQVNNDYKDMFDGSTRIYRDEAVRLVLNGTYTRDDFESKKQEGIISKFLALNPENNVAVVEFHGEEHTQEQLTNYEYNTDASTLLNWMNSANYNDPANSNAYIDTRGQIANATNYCAGLSQANDVLNDPAVRNNGHKKVMLFLSDGVPTVYLEKYADGSYKKGGTGNTGDDNNPNDNLQLYRNKSLEFFNKLIAPDAHPDLVAYTVGISKDATDESSEVGVHSPWVMKRMAEAGGGEFIAANTTEGLRNALSAVVRKSYYSQLKISDTLSQYVDLYGVQPDYKVTMKTAEGVESTLYENGAVTEAGKGKLKEVVYDPAAKTVSAVFAESYKLEEGCVYTLSFNVRTSQAAYDHHASNPYPHVGDANTDYMTNATSSGQQGYYSNDKATVSYTSAAGPNEELYDLPVVQVQDYELTIEKKWYSYGEPGADITNTKNGEIEFELYQKIYSIQPKPPDPATVSLFGLRGSNSAKLGNDYPTSVGATATLKFQCSNFDGLMINDREIPPGDVTSEGWGLMRTYTYTFPVEGDTQVYIKYSSRYMTPTISDLTFVPPPVVTGPTLLDSKLYRQEPYKLSRENGWKTVIKNIPKTGKYNDADVYYEYFVKEVVSEGGYTTTYENNGGVNTGTITINNKSTVPPTHVLPATGGGGILPYTAGGLLLTLLAVIFLMYIHYKKCRKEDSASP